jgi:hypothetical protein
MLRILHETARPAAVEESANKRENAAWHRRRSPTLVSPPQTSSNQHAHYAVPAPMPMLVPVPVKACAPRVCNGSAIGGGFQRRTSSTDRESPEREADHWRMPTDRRRWDSLWLVIRVLREENRQQRAWHRHKTTPRLSAGTSNVEREERRSADGEGVLRRGLS